MSLKRKVQISAIVFLLLAIILLIPNTDWTKQTSVFGFVSLILGTAGSIISIFIPTSFVYQFLEKSWTIIEPRENTLTISAKKHGMGRSPQVQTFLKSNSGYEEVGVLTSIDEKGNVTIGASSTFSGKIIVSN